MIPQSQDFFMQDENSQNFEILPTKTYRIDPVNKRIIGMIDGKDAVMQAIRKVLSTDKYAYEIYDWYYGNELIKLVGRSIEYAKARIPNIMKEALLVDDRITDVRDFVLTQPKIDTLVVSCIVDTVYGEIRYEQEVAV
jgi:hypothetical protein